MRRLLLTALLSAAVFAVAPAPRADEGMWTFDNPPRQLWKERYGFEPSDEWLAHVRLASVRLNDGGSGSFVSPDGLLMTNQHVAGGQLQKVSTRERDYVKNGFYAATREAEIKCPDLEVNVLISYENVTRRVQGAVQEGASATSASDQRRAAAAAIEKESAEKTGLRSDVVALYNGGEYWLYRFKKYTDLRIVFSPEEQIGFFGGDYDNFTYPRYDLDVAFFRVYENGQPARIDHYFKWSANGPAERELVFISGNPGSTAADAGADRVPARLRQPAAGAGVDGAARRARPIRRARRRSVPQRDRAAPQPREFAEAARRAAERPPASGHCRKERGAKSARSGQRSPRIRSGSARLARRGTRSRRRTGSIRRTSSV